VSTCRVAKALHLKQTNLVETPGKNVDDVAIMRRAFCKVFIELEQCVNIERVSIQQRSQSHLQCLLVVLNIISVDVVVGSNGLPQLGSHNHARSFGCRATSEEHDATPSVLEG
jgi:hypothetical protein